MALSPLAVGLITGAAEVEDPVIADAIAQMLDASTEGDLRQAVLDLTGLAVALGQTLGAEIQVPLQTVLSAVVA